MNTLNAKVVKKIKTYNKQIRKNKQENKCSEILKYKGCLCNGLITNVIHIYFYIIQYYLAVI